MTSSRHIVSDSIGRRRGALALVLAILWGIPLFAQAPRGDPVEAFFEALNRDLDYLPTQDEKVRQEILSFRKKNLEELASRLTTASDLARVLRDPERQRKTTSRFLWGGVDGDVFRTLLDRYHKKMEEAVAGTNRADQEAFAVVVGSFASNLPTFIEDLEREDAQRKMYREALLEKFVPLLAKLAAVPDRGVQVAVARSLGTIVRELREDLRPPNQKKNYDLIVDAIRSIQKPTSSPAARAAAIEAIGSIIRPLNPNPGEEALNQRGVQASREDLDRVLRLAPTLFQSFKDSDPTVRRLAVSTFQRLTALLVKDFSVLLQTPPFPLPNPDRPKSKEEREALEAAQKRLLDELRDRIRPQLEALHKEPTVFTRAITDPDPEIRFQALRALEDLAIMQGFIRDRIIALPKADAPKPREELPSPLGYLEPLFEQTAEAVVGALKDPEDRVRLAAAQLLESRRELARPLAAALVQALKDPNLFVRWVAARALGRMEGPPAPGAVEGLAALLCEYDLSVRMAAAAALETLGARADGAEAALLKAIHHGDPEFREAALAALRTVGQNAASVVAEAAKELTHPDPRVRRAAAQTITRFGKAAALVSDALRKALQDEDADVRRFAAEALLAAEGK